MRQKSGPEKARAEQVVKDIRQATRRQFSAEEKIRIVLEVVCGEESILRSSLETPVCGRSIFVAWRQGISPPPS